MAKAAKKSKSAPKPVIRKKASPRRPRARTSTVARVTRSASLSTGIVIGDVIPPPDNFQGNPHVYWDGIGGCVRNIRDTPTPEPPPPPPA